MMQLPSLGGPLQTFQKHQGTQHQKLVLHTIAGMLLINTKANCVLVLSCIARRMRYAFKEHVETNRWHYSIDKIRINFTLFNITRQSQVAAY